MGDYSEGIIATSGLTKDYSFEQFSYAGNNTWLINARTVGLEEIVFEESSDWRGFTKMKILYIGEEATNETTFREGDSDNDGVPDEWDECPETATDAFTDRNGCEVTVDDLLDGNGADAEGMPGFTAVFAVIALLGAIVVTHRKEE